MLLSRVRTAHILNTPQVRKWFYYGYLRHIGDTATLTAIEESVDKLRINQHKVGNRRRYSIHTCLILITFCAFYLKIIQDVSICYEMKIAL